MEKLKDTLDNLSLTNDEAKRLSEAFKKEEFKKLFLDYAKELQDPENRRKYEEELSAMENERGMNVEFINPNPGHVLKTIQNGGKKIFVNICHSDKINKAEAKKSHSSQGSNWSIPHSFTPPREDIDKKREDCLVYDVVFNPETYELGQKNPRFRNMLHLTALEGLEKTFNVTIDKINFKILKMKMKGPPTATVIRRKQSDFEQKQAELKNTEDKLSFPYPNLPEETEIKYYDINATTEKGDNKKQNEFTKPEYQIKYSNKFDITKFVGDKTSYHYSKPDSMCIEIKLPMLNSAKGIDLDINRQNLKLSVERPVKYLLELKLTYPVIPDNGTAKFDKSTKLLTLNIPIEKLPEVQSVFQVDSNDKNDELVEEIEQDIESYENNGVNNETEYVHNETLSEINDDIKEPIIDRKEPCFQPKFQFLNQNSRIILLIDIKNIQDNSCKIDLIHYEETTCRFNLIFNSIGQGGWINYYKVPMEIKSNLKLLETIDLHDRITFSIDPLNLIVKIDLNITEIDFVVLDVSAKQFYENKQKELEWKIQKESMERYQNINSIVQTDSNWDSLEINQEISLNGNIKKIRLISDICQEQQDLNDEEITEESNKINNNSSGIEQNQAKSRKSVSFQEIVSIKEIDDKEFLKKEIEITELSNDDQHQETKLEKTKNKTNEDKTMKQFQEDFYRSINQTNEPIKTIELNCDLLFDLE